MEVCNMNMYIKKTLLTDNTEKTLTFYKLLGFTMDTDVECRTFLKVLNNYGKSI